jgi:hypothetical protein
MVDYDYDIDGKLVSRRCVYTNADRIRSLSDDELEAEYWRIYKQLPCWTDSRAWLHQWLREESCE